MICINNDKVFQLHVSKKKELDALVDAIFKEMCSGELNEARDLIHASHQAALDWLRDYIMIRNKKGGQDA